MRRTRHRPRLASALVVGCVLLIAGGCVQARRPQAPEPPHAAVVYVDAPLSDLDVSAERARFLEWRRSGRPADGVARLDRLLDVFDAARFARDDDVRARAREVLWAELGSPEEGRRGEGATQAAILRLYEVASSVEVSLAQDETKQAGGGARGAAPPRRMRSGGPEGDSTSLATLADARSFVADAVQLLATDTFTPRTAEELAIRTLVHRTLSESGHARIADNARWRRLDHVVATMEAAVSAPARRRSAIGRVVEWDTADDPVALQEARDDGQLPTTEEIEAWISLAQSHRTALAKDARWRGIAAGWEAPDAALADRVRAFVPVQLAEALPVPRVSGIELAPVPAAPRLRVDAAGSVTLDGAHGDLSTTKQRGAAARDEPVPADTVDLLRKAMLALGSDGVVIVMDAEASAAALRVVLDVATEAGAVRVDLVLRDATTRRPGVVGIPLVTDTTTGPLTRALDAAVGLARVSDGGVSLELRVDGARRTTARLATGPLSADVLAQRWLDFTVAYPRASVVPVVLEGDATLQSIVTLITAASANPRAATPTGDVKPTRRSTPLLVLDRRGETNDTSAKPTARRLVDALRVDALLSTRAQRLAGAAASVTPAIPLPPGDMTRLERVADGLVACTAELVPVPSLAGERGAARPARAKRTTATTSVSVLLPFWDGRVDRSRPLDVVITPAPPALVRAAVADCVESSLLGVALASQRDPVEVTLAVTTR